VASAFVLVAQSEDGAVFVSRDGAQPPQLVITLEDMISTPITTSPSDPSVAEDAVLLAAGDIADCDLDGDEATESLLDDLLRSDPAVTVATLDDTFYNSGTAQEFVDCYEPTWGRHKSRTRPAVCNHKYGTAGAAGYFVYFGSAVDDPTKGFYSYELGSWHIVVLNANCNQAGGCGAGSPQETWLRQDLAAHPTSCTLAYWHYPRFSFGHYGNDTLTQALWQALDDNDAEIVLSGHDHNYQRYAPQTPTGTRDDARGIRDYVVGTGGRSHYPLRTPPATVETFNGDTFGILQLTPRPDGYD
jgi:acid phosphatase type 7